MNIGVDSISVLTCLTDHGRYENVADMEMGQKHILPLCIQIKNHGIILGMEKNRFDSTRGYCRMLGHEVDFSYCRIAKDGLPCFKVLDCWFERFPVEKFIDDNYTDEEKKIIFTRPENKVTTLFDLIEKAKKNIGQ